MDTSETRIKMCEKAEEIQKLWQPAHGDYYWGNDSIYEPDFPEYLTDRRRYEVHLLADFDSEGGHFHLEPKHIDKSRHTWLPHQDQLQEMMFTHWNFNYTLRLLHEFTKWVDTGGYGKYENNTMGQLWLAFVMKEKYNKVWNGDSWIYT